MWTISRIRRSASRLKIGHGSYMLRILPNRIPFFFFFNDTAPPEISPLSLPDALPICRGNRGRVSRTSRRDRFRGGDAPGRSAAARGHPRQPRFRIRDGRRRRGEDRVRRSVSDRKSTRLNLQSQSNLVCRLLLETKKQTFHDHPGVRPPSIRHPHGTPRLPPPCRRVVYSAAGSLSEP